MSFVHEASDIDRLYAELDRLNAPDLGVILKIENRAAFERLPELLMTASKRRRIAVMVARGDLGVEIGFERLAEVQEEILWLDGGRPGAGDLGDAGARVSGERTACPRERK